MGTNHLLKSKAGQFVTVQEIRGSLNLCTVPHQGGEKNALWVQIYANTKNQLAFSFKHQDCCYFPKVVEKVLQLEKIDDPNKLTENHRFEKFNIGSGEHYGLRSVVKPRQYLHVKRSNHIYVVHISEKKLDCVAVTDEPISDE